MKKTYEELVDEIHRRFNGNISVLDEYVGNKKSMKFFCNTHMQEFMTTPQSILHSKYGCRLCSQEHVRQSHIMNGLNSKYGRLIDEHPDTVKQWNYEKNIGIDINYITSKSGQNVWWNCIQCGKPYQSKVCSVTNSSGRCICKDCNEKNFSQKKVDAYLKTKGSFGDNFPHLLEEWDYELNSDLSPSDFTNKSNKKVWWRCNICGESWKVSIAHRTEGDGCPSCARKSNSRLQSLVEDYIQSHYSYSVLHERNCTLKCINQNTGYMLPYDNDVLLPNNQRLIIEVHGQQHYEICGWTLITAKTTGKTPEEVLEYQQYRDQYKKDYALSQGYHYLAIPYWTESDDSYKTLIDDTIHKILNS